MPKLSPENWVGALQLGGKNLENTPGIETSVEGNEIWESIPDWRVASKWIIAEA